MGKHSTQFAVIVRAGFSAGPMMVGMPLVDVEDAAEEMRRLYSAGNYDAWVNEINPVTGKVVTEYVAVVFDPRPALLAAEK